MDDIAELSGNRTDAGAVMFALSALPLVESAEVWIEANSDVGSDEQSPAKIGRTALAHAIVGRFKRAGLRDGCINSRIGNELGRGLEAANIPDFAENHRAEHGTNAGNGGNRRVQFFHDGADFGLRVCDLLFKEKLSLQWVTPKERLAVLRICVALA